METARAKQQGAGEEEAIIRKRFLLQTVGTSTTAIPPFKKLVVKYTQYCQSLQHGSIEEFERLYEELLADLYSVQAQIHRLHAIAAAFHREQLLYQQKQQRLQAEITQAEQDISDRKLELEAARSELSRQQQYEATKKRVSQIPSKSATKAEMEIVEKEIADLLQQGNAVDGNMEHRKMQFASILELIEKVHAPLNDDDDNGGGGAQETVRAGDPMLVG